MLFGHADSGFPTAGGGEGGEDGGKRTQSCRSCGSTELEANESRGEIICCRCGTVLEDLTLVDGLQFAESSSGGVSMVGQFVSSCTGAGRGLRAGVGGGGDSREQTLQRGFNNIQSIAERLRLSSQQHISSAHRLYLMATQRNFTLGRRSVLVASACLYAICRRERTPHLLIDFCDVLRTNVRALGQVFMKLLRVLHLQVPHVDPSLFLERFACQMQLGDKTHTVAQTGVRLIQAMNRDWISTGRRPMGLCGAALLIAARYHNFQMNAEDIAHIVRVSGPTVNRRLQEFKQTATAQLAVADFESTDLLSLPSQAQPPCRIKAYRRKLKLMQKKEEETLALTDSPAVLALPSTAPEEKKARQGCEGESEEHAEANGDEQGDNGESQRGETEETEDVSLATVSGDSRPKRFAEFAAVGNLHLDTELLCKETPSPEDILMLAGRMASALDGRMHGNPSQSTSASCREEFGTQRDVSHDACVAGESRETHSTAGESGGAEDGRTLSLDASGTGQVGSEDPTLPSRAHTSRLRCSDVPSASSASSSASSSFLSGVVSRAFCEDGEESRSVRSGGGRFGDTETVGSTERGEEEDDDSDEEEIRAMFLSESEQRAKALIWDELTKDVMPLVHRRLKEKKLREREMMLNQSKRKRLQSTGRRNRFGSDAGSAPAASAAESVRLALQMSSRSIVGKINDDALNSLFGPVRRVTEENGN
ncbi:UNVERIFIED_CONTAM: transcription initiation factor TFIIIB [Hammondia hammondi]|eukprot:XP_008886902.1 transcription initiation factor TFIIIB [Hammondia hammondi]